MNDAARTILDNNRYAVLATVTADGAPWAVPVRIAFDDTTLYWMSKVETVHSQNVTQDRRVSLVVFDSHQTSAPEGKGAVYIATVAQELVGEDAEKARDLYCTRHPDRADEKFSSWHMYSAPIGEVNEVKSHGTMVYFTSNGETA